MPKSSRIDELSLWISNASVSELLLERERKFDLETGGILLGYRIFQGASEHWVITKVIGPGKNAVHRKRSYIPDYEYHEKTSIEHFHETLGGEYYLGDWHTHPNASPCLSWRDNRTLLRNSKHAIHTEQRSLMLIIGGLLEEPTFLGHIGNALNVKFGIFATPVTVRRSEHYDGWIKFL